MNKKKRKDCFFGLHFDFHAIAATKDIGSKTVPEKIGEFLDTVKPDYIQIDTKGHPGYSSYFTKYGTVAPGLTCDHLKIIREETAKRGILLFAHHSSLWDNAAGKEHPDYNVIDANGKRAPWCMDIFSKYVDERLVPQMKELCKDYGFDGVWMDGEYGSCAESYKPEILEAFYKKTGYTEVDRKPDSPSRLAYRQFFRDAFFDYLKHYITEIKAECPDFEVASNMAFGLMHPYKAIDEVDFLSGDVSYNGAIRIFARAFASQNKQWDIMSWAAPGVFKIPPRDFVEQDGAEGGFNPMGSMNIKRICRGAAITMALGGGVQTVNAMTPQGEIRMIDMHKMKQLADFVRARQPFNFQSKPLPNAAFLITYEDNARYGLDTDVVFATSKSISWGCNIVLTTGRPYDLVYAHHVLEGDLKGRKVLIVPENRNLPEDLKKALVDFAKDGGTLIICGEAACKEFAVQAPDLKLEDGGLVYVASTEAPEDCCGMESAINFVGDAQKLCLGYQGKMDLDAPAVSPAVSVSLGKGNLVLIGFDILTTYMKTGYYVLADIMGDILSKFDPQPLTYLEKGEKRVELVPAEKDGKLMVNVTNGIEYGLDGFRYAYDPFPAIHDITVAVKCDKKPNSVFLEPEHTLPEYSYDGQYLHVKLDKVDIHTIIVVE